MDARLMTMVIIIIGVYSENIEKEKVTNTPTADKNKLSMY